MTIHKENDDITDGVLTCSNCLTWYKIDGGILDLLPLHLRRKDLYTKFALHHGLRVETNDPDGEDPQKLEQITFFKDNFESYEKTVVNNPYFRALTALKFERWLSLNCPLLLSGPPTLEIGCGTGQQTLIMARRNIRVIAIDLSEEMIGLARQKTILSGSGRNVDYVVSDAENLPVKNDRFGACVCWGTLHHINNPGKIILESARKLRNGGLFFTLDPHDSPIRFLFDFLMKIWKLYDDQASEKPLMKGKDLATWLANAGIKNTISYSTYIPPHVFVGLSSKTAIFLLKNSDAAFNAIPGFSIFAGAIISEGVKSEGVEAD